MLVLPSWELWYMASHHVVYPFEKNCRTTFMIKRCRRNQNTMPLSPYQTFSCKHLPVPHQSYQPWTCLQSVWITPFLNFISWSQAITNILIFGSYSTSKFYFIKIRIFKGHNIHTELVQGSKYMPAYLEKCIQHTLEIVYLFYIPVVINQLHKKIRWRKSTHSSFYERGKDLKYFQKVREISKGLNNWRIIGSNIE